MTPEALYQGLGQLIANFPDFSSRTWDTPESRLWLGRAAVLVEIAGQGTDHIAFKNACDWLGTATHTINVQTIKSILYRCLARAEAAAPTTAQGSFIPAGEPFTALRAISSVFGAAKKSVFIIDPYADANLVTDFAPLAPEDIPVFIMADESSCKPGLRPAVAAWAKQHGSSRPLTARLSAARTLHDRIIIIDEEHAWTVGQSFNALATRSPTAITRANAETASLKVNAYVGLWKTATPLQ